jgi:hypothetical protein
LRTKFINGFFLIMAARLDLEISPIKFRNPVQETAFGGAAIAVDMMRHLAVPSCRHHARQKAPAGRKSNGFIVPSR